MCARVFVRAFVSVCVCASGLDHREKKHHMRKTKQWYCAKSTDVLRAGTGDCVNIHCIHLHTICMERQSRLLPLQALQDFFIVSYSTM